MLSVKQEAENKVIGLTRLGVGIKAESTVPEADAFTTQPSEHENLSTDQSGCIKEDSLMHQVCSAMWQLIQADKCCRAKNKRDHCNSLLQLIMLSITHRA